LFKGNTALEGWKNNTTIANNSMNTMNDHLTNIVNGTGKAQT
jgi:hypothetical protein